MKNPLSYPIALDSWLFSKGRPESLALMRILFCAIAFFSFLVQIGDLDAFYGVSGLMTPAALDLWQWRGWTFNPLTNADPLTIRIAFSFALITSLTACIGLFTKTSLISLLVLLLAFHNRNPMLLNSGDSLLSLAVFYLSLSACGKVWSLDNQLFQKEDISKLYSLWPQRLISIQIALLYFTTVWHKMQGGLWRDGSVTWYISRIEELSRFELPAFLMTESAARFTTWGTLIAELALCTLIWFKPYRNWVLFAGLMLHAGIEYNLNIPFFGLITVTCYISFLRPEEVRSAISKISSVFKIGSSGNKKRNPVQSI